MRKMEPEEPHKGGFFLERRKEASENLDDNAVKAETSSLKRFVKYVNQCIKLGKRSNKTFSLARVNVLEIESLETHHARKLDESLKAIIMDYLRKSDRIYSNERGSYLILLPNTDRKSAVRALTRITEGLSDFSFSQSDFVIRPSSIFNLIPEDTLVSRGARELLEELGVVFEESDSKSSALSKLDRHSSLFTGSVNDWFARYALEDKAVLKFRLEERAKLKIYKGFDIWSEHRPVLVRELAFSNSEGSSCDFSMERLLQFFRQMQSLSKSSVSPLCDFHHVKDKIYLVNSIPDFDRCIGVLEVDYIQGHKHSFRTDKFKKVVFKLTGALSYLHSLVPPTVLSDYRNLLIFYNEKDEVGFSDLKVVNYDIERLMMILTNTEKTQKPHEDIVGFADFVLELNERFFQSTDSQLVELLTRLAGGTVDREYNSFSKLRSFLKEKAPV